MIPISRFPPEPAPDDRVLDVGCGEHKHPGAVGLDARAIDPVDVAGSATDLPFEDDTFDYLYSSHVIEHFSHQTGQEVLREWTRVLCPGGTIEIRCPYLRIRALLFALRPNRGDVKNIYGGQGHEYDYHKQGFSFGLLRDDLRACGVRDVTMTVDWDEGIPFVPSDLHVFGTVERA